MSLNSDLYFSKPRKIDDESLARTIVNSYDTEIARRKRSVDDEYRYDLEKYREAGRFTYGDLSIHDLFQKSYADKYGEFIPLNTGWECPHCHTKYMCGLPPTECNVCHTKSPLGQYVDDGYWRK
jgi:hypothetical protein